jgi:hypothetical protein
MNTLKRTLYRTFAAFLTLEVTAAAWHLLFFRATYVAETGAFDRGFENYLVPYLVGMNFVRAIIYALIFEAFRRATRLTNLKESLLFGLAFGTISALSVVEYYGVWEFASWRWPVRWCSRARPSDCQCTWCPMTELVPQHVGTTVGTELERVFRYPKRGAGRRLHLAADR